jgi:hypothetical protein
MYVCFMQLLCLLPSLASQKSVLRGNTSRASNPLRPSYFQRVHYKFLCMVFQTIPSKLSCATFQKPSNTSHFVPLFSAHQDIVVWLVIFHTKLSTPRLGSLMRTSLQLIQPLHLQSHFLMFHNSKDLSQELVHAN